MPDKGPSLHPIIPDINITTVGILKLLQNLDVHKASGPDQVSSRFLKETAESITPILKTIFTYSKDQSLSWMIGKKHLYTSKVIALNPAIIGPSLLSAFYPRYLNITLFPYHELT